MDISLVCLFPFKRFVLTVINYFNKSKSKVIFYKIKAILSFFTLFLKCAKNVL